MSNLRCSIVVALLAAVTAAQAAGPVGRKVRRSSSSSSSSSSSDSSSPTRPKTAIERLEDFEDDLVDCDEEARALSEGCPAFLFSEPIGCLLKLAQDVEDLDVSELPGARTANAKELYVGFLTKIRARIWRLEGLRDAKANRKAATQCRPRASRWTVGWQVFGVDPGSYAPIQGKIETPGSWGYGTSLWASTDGLWTITDDAEAWLDWDFLFEYQRVPLKRRSFGDNDDVTFDEDIEWMRVQPFNLTLSWFRNPNRSSGWMDMVALRASLGPSLVHAALSQQMDSNYMDGQTQRSDTIGSLYVPVMSALGYHFQVKAFVPVYWHFGILAEAKVNDFPRMRFSNPEQVAHKVTFDDLRRNDRYTWYDYGVHLATRNTSFGVDAGYIWTVIRGSGGTGINNRTVLLNLSWSWDVKHAQDSAALFEESTPGVERKPTVDSEPVPEVEPEPEVEPLPEVEPEVEPKPEGDPPAEPGAVDKSDESSEQGVP